MTNTENANKSNWCYWLGEFTSEGIIPAKVERDVAGYRLFAGNGPHARPWYWGKTQEEFDRVCDAENERLGLTRSEALDIVISSMRAGNRAY